MLHRFLFRHIVRIQIDILILTPRYHVNSFPFTSIVCISSFPDAPNNTSMLSSCLKSYAIYYVDILNILYQKCQKVRCIHINIYIVSKTLLVSVSKSPVFHQTQKFVLRFFFPLPCVCKRPLIYEMRHT